VTTTASLVAALFSTITSFALHRIYDTCSRTTRQSNPTSIQYKQCNTVAFDMFRILRCMISLPKARSTKRRGYCRNDLLRNLGLN